jgi:hypothetical protein
MPTVHDSPEEIRDYRHFSGQEPIPMDFNL